MSKHDDQVWELLQEVRAEVKSLRAEVLSAMGFIKGAKYAISILVGLVTIGLIKLGFNFKVIGQAVDV